MTQTELAEIARSKSLDLGRIKHHDRIWFFVKTKRGELLNDGYGLQINEAAAFIQEYHPESHEEKEM